MMKTLSNIFKQDKEKFVIPRSVQQVIPIETIRSDGIFKIGRNKFARTDKFTDINYAVAVSYTHLDVYKRQAHEIGKKLAEELWGSQYQVLIATHLDKANHCLLYTSR